MMEEKIMNKRNNWQQILDFANADLRQYGVSLKVERDDENTYSVNIVTPNGEEQYACGYYEDELESLIADACDWVLRQKIVSTRICAEDLQTIFDGVCSYIVRALVHYVAQHGEKFTDYHMNEFGIEPEDNERVLSVVNFYDNEGCQYCRYVGGKICEPTVIQALYLVTSGQGRLDLKYCGFYNVGLEYDEDDSEPIHDSVSKLCIEELREIIKAIRTIKK